jgi:hypothetical protein
MRLNRHGPKLIFQKNTDFEWRGSNTEKKAKLIKWLANLDHEPTAEEAAETFGFSLATYDNWGIADMWHELQKK